MADPATSADPSAQDPVAAATGISPGAGSPSSLETPSGMVEVHGLQALYDLGGPVVILLGLFSVFALFICIKKLLQFRRARLWATRDVDSAVTLYRGGETRAAELKIGGLKGPLARVVGVAMSTHARGDRAIAREETESAGQAAVEELRNGLRPLEFIAGVSPLLGLFGTVLGMITAFQAMESAGSRVDPSILAGGIWEALFTTAAGLAVAIPALALSNWFERIVDKAAHRIEYFAGRVLTAPALIQPAQQQAIPAVSAVAAISAAAAAE